MRYQIAQEIEQAIPTHILLDGALTWDDNPLPVVSRELAILGKATDVRREDNGVITAEIEIDPSIDFESIREEVGFTVTANDLDTSWNGDVLTVKSARIREVFVSPGVPWNAVAR